MNKPPFIKSTLFLAIATMLMLSLLLAACGDSTTATTAATTANTSTNTQAPATTSGGGSTTTDSGNTATATTAAATSGSGSGGAAPQPAATTAASTTAAGAAAPTAPAKNNDSSDDVRNTPPPSQVNQEPLKAGAVDDNLKFDEYLRYLRNYQDRPGLPFDISERYIISVMDGNARTVANSTVRVYSGNNVLFEGKTYSNGQIMFFPRAISTAQQLSTFEVTAEKDGRSANASFKRTENGQNQNANGGTIWTLQMNGSLRPAIDPSPNLDLLFLLDSTGSMGGEIRQIQQTISDISRQISELPGSPKVRYGVVTYRDRGDSYVTRKFGFTTNLGDFSNFLNSISAGGGGDKPESVQEALHVAIDDMNWSTGDSVRLTFLVADAAPHLDYQQDYKYTDTIQTAVKKGIKVYTIGASGLEKQGEYVFRQLSQITLAQFLFVTRGGDEQTAGSGGPASNTNVVYEEKNLDRIVVNIVRRELTNLTQ